MGMATVLQRPTQRRNRSRPLGQSRKQLVPLVLQRENARPLMSRTQTHEDWVVCELVKILEDHIGMPILCIAAAKNVDTVSFFAAAGWTPEDLDSMFRAVGLAALDADRKSTRLNSSHPSISYAVF